MQHMDGTSASIISSSAVAMVIWEYSSTSKVRLLGRRKIILYQFSAGEIDKLLRMQDRERHEVEAANVKLYSVWE